MIETWRDSWFEEGSRLIYIVPAAAVDSILPLQVEPAPVQTVRVFVGRIELVTPETQRAVESAIAGKDWSTVSRYSRFLDPILKRISSGDPVRGRRDRGTASGTFTGPSVARRGAGNLHQLTNLVCLNCYGTPRPGKTKNAARSVRKPAPKPQVPEIVRIFQRLGRMIPEEELRRIPKDLSDQVDHYVYGTPKRY